VRPRQKDSNLEFDWTQEQRTFRDRVRAAVSDVVDPGRATGVRALSAAHVVPAAPADMRRRAATAGIGSMSAEEICRVSLGTHLEHNEQPETAIATAESARTPFAS